MGNGAHVCDGVGGRDEGHRRHDHFVVVFDPGEHEGGVKGGRSIDRGDRGTGSGERCKHVLETIDVGARGRDPA